MKNIIRIIPLLIFSLLSFGCSVIYTTAVDQRDVKTILNDTTIKFTIVNKFYDDEAINSLNLSSGCYRGHVYLVGEYDKAFQKKRAIKIAKSIEGVRSVSTYLLPKKKDDVCGTDDNIKLALEVKTKLVADKDIWSTNIDVKTVQCNVVLYGLVASDNKIKKAISHAKSVEGVRSVKCFLTSAN
ncbi:MAG TPA: BON domain-containing protein [Desulfobacterales bacterium]|nr:BON domain-containing protein [Desulfobacterales bacterium]